MSFIITNKVIQEHIILSINYSFNPQGHTSKYNNQIFIFYKFYFDIKLYNCINK